MPSGQTGTRTFLSKQQHEFHNLNVDCFSIFMQQGQKAQLEGVMQDQSLTGGSCVKLSCCLQHVACCGVQ